MRMNDVITRARKWLEPPFDKSTQDEIRHLIGRHPKELDDRFYKDLAFGTGGMRGIMGAGTNRINKYTLGKATQGLSLYLKDHFKDTPLKVAIAYDCRHHSKEFARIVAGVFAANDIEVFLFDDLRPTPELSFAVRHLNCHAGIVLTASHNPPEYNSYKVYFDDGGQIVPPHDKKIIAYVNKIDFNQIRFDGDPHLITQIGHEVDKAFLRASLAEGTFDDVIHRNKLKIVFTSLHGTSIKLIPDALKMAGYTDVHVVEEQRTPDGDFPTVSSPNPEEPAALKMAMDLAERIDADIVIGTDPDSDRIGIAVRNLEGKLQLLNGNQTMCILTDYLIKKRKKQNRLNKKPFIGSTIVSTPMMIKIAADHGVECKVGLTGFKWIAKMIRDAEGTQDFIGGGEESFGYMVGDFIRDKDAVTATLLACEIATQTKASGAGIYQALVDLYRHHGCYHEHLISIVKKGKAGADHIKKTLLQFREHPPRHIDGSPIVQIADYQNSIKTNLQTNEKHIIRIPKSNVLIYHAADGTVLAVRPSGTEPKIKFYISVHHPLENNDHYIEVNNLLKQKIKRIIKEIENRIDQIDVKQ